MSLSRSDSRPFASRKYRLVIVQCTYPPVVGGAEADAQRVSVALIGREHQVEVLCEGGPPMPPRRAWVDDSGVPVQILTHNQQGRWKHILFAIESARYLWCNRRTIHVVLLSMSGLYLASGLFVGRIAGIPTISKIHGSKVIPAMAASRIGRMELKWLAKWAARVMVLNDEMVQEAIDAGIPREKLMHMPNPVDTVAFSPPSPAERFQLRARCDIPPDARVLLYTGRLSPEKGVDWLVTSFAQVASHLPGALLVLLGDGPSRAALEDLVVQLGLTSQVRFVGRVASQEVPSWLRAADAFALVSPNEGFSCALAEAMAVGLPAVVSAIPANLQLIDDGVHGFTAPAGDIAATAAAISKMLDDADIRHQMGTVARKRIVDNYSLDRIADRYEQLFAEIVPG